VRFPQKNKNYVFFFWYSVFIMQQNFFSRDNYNILKLFQYSLDYIIEFSFEFHFRVTASLPILSQIIGEHESRFLGPFNCSQALKLTKITLQFQNVFSKMFLLTCFRSYLAKLTKIASICLGFYLSKLIGILQRTF
jgi:hypothetical protein